MELEALGVLRQIPGREILNSPSLVNEALCSITRFIKSSAMMETSQLSTLADILAAPTIWEIHQN